MSFKLGIIIILALSLVWTLIALYRVKRQIKTADTFQSQANETSEKIKEFTSIAELNQRAGAFAMDFCAANNQIDSGGGLQAHRDYKDATNRLFAVGRLLRHYKENAEGNQKQKQA